MKLRVLENSIRLRLTQTEVKDLVGVGYVRETTQFGPNNFLKYELIMKNIPELMVNFQDGKISVALPSSIGIDWAKGVEISLRQTIPTTENSEILILIEKDFKCKTEREGEDEGDMFPNPNC